MEGLVSDYRNSIFFYCHGRASTLRVLDVGKVSLSCKAMLHRTWQEMNMYRRLHPLSMMPINLDHDR